MWWASYKSRVTFTGWTNYGQRVAEAMFLPHGWNGVSLLRNLADMFPSYYKKSVIYATWQKCSPRVKEECYWGHVAEMFPLCCKRYMLLVTWWKCYSILVAKVALHSAHGRHIVHILLQIGTTPVMPLLNWKATLHSLYFWNSHATTHVSGLSELKQLTSSKKICEVLVPLPGSEVEHVSSSMLGPLFVPKTHLLLQTRAVLFLQFLISHCFKISN